jgi:hypothetical protein
MGRCLTVQWIMPHFSCCYKPSPLQAHWWRWDLSCLLRPACLFTVCMGSAPPPPSSGACHTLATGTSFPLSKVAGLMPLLLLSPTGLFIYSSVESAPPPFSRAHSPLPSLLCVFFFSAPCLLISLVFSLFSLGGGQSVQGTMLIWPKVVCGSTACHLAQLVVCFSQSV